MNLWRTLIKYKEHANAIIFVIGFIFDSIMLSDPYEPIIKWVGLTYLLFIAIAIIVREGIVALNRATKREQQMYSFLSFVISYFTGSALSYLFVLYFKSAELSVSWPFFLSFFLIIIVNEYISSHSFRLILDMIVLFISTTFYIVFNAPLVFKEVSDHVFVLSMIISSVVLLLYSLLLRLTSDVGEEYSTKGQGLAVVVPLAVSFLYFGNLIPAIPLSLSDAGIYHYVTKDDQGDFILNGKESAKFPLFQKTIFHYGKDDTGVYFYGAVKAPANITAPLSHVWEYYDPKLGWVTKFTVAYSIQGGRDTGYRSYSYLQNIQEGLWRVSVMSDGNRVVGRITFTVKKDN